MSLPRIVPSTQTAFLLSFEANYLEEMLKGRGVKRGKKQ